MSLSYLAGCQGSYFIYRTCVLDNNVSSDDPSGRQTKTNQETRRNQTTLVLTRSGTFRRPSSHQTGAGQRPLHTRRI